MPTVMRELFDDAGATQFDDGAWLLRGFALEREAALLAAIETVAAQAPFRHMETRRGLRMSVAMTNCGEVGWVSDRRGYRYAPRDPLGGGPWPVMPEAFAALAGDAARAAGFEAFAPDACLVNRYVPGTRLSLHQDRDERDFDAPIVSVSLGLPATFLFGGLARSDRTRRIALRHGDVVVWGGASRLFHHGVLALADGVHPVMGARRINLTFRKAL
ncbi:DNA oxidative demethylase AlkB [Luteimonas lutimaris]|uniref:DNA oxidative demethylase AlkB n=2 Tax=Luteimonas lutimaris TaxID=698645 RepID=A0ABP7MIH6_9GAMM